MSGGPGNSYDGTLELIALCVSAAFMVLTLIVFGVAAYYTLQWP